MADVFAQNHLSRVVSNEQELKAYLVHALNIAPDFLEHFTQHDWISALEHTLYYRPNNTTTEDYLKTQRLWIMHKLLLRADLGGVYQRVLKQLNNPTLTATARSDLETHLELAQERVRQTPGLFTAVEGIEQMLVNFRERFGQVVQEEKRQHINNRCDVIRWMSWLVCQQNGEAWLQKASVTELKKNLDSWRADR